GKAEGKGGGGGGGDSCFIHPPPLHLLPTLNLHKGCKFTTTEWIERVIIVGVNTEPKHIHLVIGDNKVELEHKYDPQTKVLTVRKPGINIGEEKWVINLH
ncbi:unnamed protein product, partial [Candidula unifasciata]